jgi:iron complex outermembrane receptor protein
MKISCMRSAACSAVKVSLLCTAAHLMTLPVTAQTLAANTLTSTPSGGDVESVIVTADKRNESLQEVPQSISVVSGQQIADQHIENYSDLSRSVPDLSFSSLGGPGLSNLEIRGISSTTGDSTVALYLDDAPITIRNSTFFSGQSEPQLFDIGQVEVLRGPQGTLYGASAMGGMIRFVSNPVNLEEFGGTASADVANTTHGGADYVVSAVVNVPIVQDTLGLRVGLESTRDSGFVDHATPDGVIDRRGINADAAKVAKATLLWQATPDLTIQPSVFYQRMQIDDVGLVDLTPASYAQNYITTKLVPEKGADTLIVSGLKMNYDLQWADMASETSYAYRSFPRTTDGTYFNSAFVGGLVDSMGITGLDGQLDGDKLSNLPGPVDNTLGVRELTQELRLVSKPYDPNSGGPFAWIFGLYYSSSLNHGTSNQFIPGFNSTLQSVYGMTAAQILGTDIPNDEFYQFSQRQNDEEYATFGELSYHLSPALQVTAGLRYLYGYSTFTQTSSGFFASQPYVSGDTKAYALTPRFSASYDMEDNVTLYATAGEGYRLGGINQPIPVPQCSPDLAQFGLTSAPESYHPDHLWNYEAGEKGSFFDGRLSVNTSIYDIEWNLIQIDIPLSTCGFDYTANVGKARSYGVENELSAHVWDGLSLGVSWQYNHDTFLEDVAGLGVSAGDPVPESPKWSVNLSADYDRPLTDRIVGFIRANWQFTDTSHGTIIKSNPDYDRPAYALLGASIGVNCGQWQVSLYGKNLLDENKIIQRPSDNYVAEGYTPTPRIVGLNMTTSF